MKKVSVTIVAVLSLLMLSNFASAQVEVFQGSQPLGTVWIGESMFVPCANNGQGEVIDLFGPEVLRYTYVVYSDGSIIGHEYAQVDFTAVGETTGATYQSKATMMFPLKKVPAGTSQTRKLMENFMMVGTGTSWHYHENITYSETLDPNTGQWTMTVYHGNISLSCN